MHTSNSTWLDRWFTFLVAVKGIDGFFEVLGGAALLLIPSFVVQGVVGSLLHMEIVTDYAFLSHAVTGLGHGFTHGVQIYTAVYLLLHGIIKVGLVIALLSRQYQLYPAAIVILILFMLYQIYRIFTLHQLAFDGTLTIVDGVVVWLTILEYQRHRPNPSLPTP